MDPIAITTITEMINYVLEITGIIKKLRDKLSSNVSQLRKEIKNCEDKDEKKLLEKKLRIEKLQRDIMNNAKSVLKNLENSLNKNKNIPQRGKQILELLKELRDCISDLRKIIFQNIEQEKLIGELEGKERRAKKAKQPEKAKKIRQKIYELENAEVSEDDEEISDAETATIILTKIIEGLNNIPGKKPKKLTNLLIDFKEIANSSGRLKVIDKKRSIEEIKKAA
ncbi:MAG: hypothetical protein ACQER9_00855 [Nanobdellota archaeon]